MALEVAGGPNRMPAQLAPAWPVDLASGHPRQKSEYPGACSSTLLRTCSRYGDSQMCCAASSCAAV